MSDRALIERLRSTRGNTAVVRVCMDAADRLEALTGGGGEPVAWRRRPKGSNRDWTLFADVDNEVEFYRSSGRYDVEPLYLSPPSGRGVEREAIRKIIDDAVNSAIPEPWEVIDHATDQILALFSSPSLGGEGKQEDSSSQGSQNDQGADAGPSPRSPDVRADDLAMLVRKLVQHVPDDKQIKAQAVDYLNRYGLGGSPLRGAAPDPQAQQDEGER